MKDIKLLLNMCGHHVWPTFVRRTVEQLPQPTEEQLERRRRRLELLAAIAAGEITSLADIHPNDTSIETVKEARWLLKALARQALRNGETKL